MIRMKSSQSSISLTTTSTSITATAVISLPVTSIVTSADILTTTAMVCDDKEINDDSSDFKSVASEDYEDDIVIAEASPLKNTAPIANMPKELKGLIRALKSESWTTCLDMSHLDLQPMDGSAVTVTVMVIQCARTAVGLLAKVCDCNIAVFIIRLHASLVTIFCYLQHTVLSSAV